MLILCSFFLSSPVYEVPSGFYTGEQILKILLNPRIDEKKICHFKQCNVSQSSTFVVDLESLQHLDDIKKDDYGNWIYSGSHSVSYAAYQSKPNIGALSEDIWDVFILCIIIDRAPTCAESCIGFWNRRRESTG